ncbi:MAG: hypothetical protein R3F49_06545 [Planctomycetota bacterium]
MHLRTALLALLCALASLGVAHAAHQTDEAAEPRKALALEVERFRATIQQLEADLRVALEARIDEECQSSKLSIENMQRIQADLELQTAAFLQDGALPEDKGLAKAARTFSKALDAALKKCCDAHTRTAEQVFRLKDRAGAAAIVSEREELRRAYDLAGKRERAQLRRWFPVGTAVKCERTNNSGGDFESDGFVSENDGSALVIELRSVSGQPILWRFQYEGGGKLRLVSNVKKGAKQPRVDIVNCAGTLNVAEGGLTGSYSWELPQPGDQPATKVTGKITVRVVKRP